MEEEPVEDEPAELLVGKTLTDKVTAGKEYKITLKPEKTETIRLTLTLNAGQNLSVKIGDKEVEFAENPSEDPAKSIYVYEKDVTEWVNVSITLSAAVDTEFKLKAETKPVAQTEEIAEDIPSENESSENEPAEEIPAEEEVPSEEKSEEVIPAEDSAEEELKDEEETEESAGEEAGEEAGAEAGEEAAEEQPEDEASVNEEAAEEAKEEETVEAAGEEAAEQPEEAEEAEEAEEVAEGEQAEEVEEETKEETEEEVEEPVDPEQVMLDNGCVKVMVIRENGTNLYNAKNADAEAVGTLAHGDVIWIKAVGGMWGEVYLDEESGPLYFNLNNVALLKGEVEYNIPIRKVRLSSTLDGLTEVDEGAEITITAEFSGFMEDEIADITWQYRPEDGEEGVFFDIEGADDFIYTYAISAENVHNEWRIVLTLKS